MKTDRMTFKARLIAVLILVLVASAVGPGAEVTQAVPVTVTAEFRGEVDVSDMQEQITLLRADVDALMDQATRPDPPPSEPPEPGEPPQTDTRVMGFNTGVVFKAWSPDKPFSVGAPGTISEDYVRLATPIADTIRFMDWISPNNLRHIDALDDGWRAMLDQQIELANRCGADFWLTVPFHASERFTQEAVGYIRAGLDDESEILIEWANEVWNTGQNAYQQLKRETGVDAGAKAHELVFFDAWAAYIDRAFSAARRADPSCVLVLGAHPENAWMTNKVYRRLTIKPDAIATTFYIGHADFTGVTTGRGMIDAAEKRWHAKGERMMEAIFAYAESVGVEVFGYEGGQHLTAPVVNGKPDPFFVPLVIEAQSDPAVLGLMDLAYNKFIELGGKRPCFYKLVSLYDQWGAWGLARSIGELKDSIKYLWAVERSAGR